MEYVKEPGQRVACALWGEAEGRGLLIAALQFLQGVTGKKEQGSSPWFLVGQQETKGIYQIKECSTGYKENLLLTMRTDKPWNQLPRQVA